MRVGLFGGTLNPVHWGHLRAAEEIRERCDLGRVIFIPTNISPHKESEEIISAPHRMNMLELAIEGNPSFTISEVELTRAGRSYSIETITHFISTYGKELTLFFILGIDAFLEIESWKNYQELFALCNFIVMSRPGYAVRELPQIIPAPLRREFRFHPDEKRFINSAHLSIDFKEITALDISSHSIRMLIKEGHSIKYLVPEKVEEYIKIHKLYS